MLGEKPICAIANGTTQSEFKEKLNQYRSKIAYDSTEGAAYPLYFMIKKGTTTGTLTYHEKFAAELRSEDTHINAERLYILTNQVNKAETAIINFVKNWLPIDHLQGMPMRLWTFEDLYPILTSYFLEKVKTNVKRILIQ